MTDVLDLPPRTGATLRSARVALARLVRDAALGVPGVVVLDYGPAGLFMTAGGGQRIPGVTCVAAGGGGYDVALRLRCALVPLLELGERVETAVRQAAAAAGLELSALTIEIVDVIDPGRA